MATQQVIGIVSGEASDIHDEPHIEGSRITVRYIQRSVEERGHHPETVADCHQLDLADVYVALAYYHTNPDEMRRVEQRRADLAARAAEMTTHPPRSNGRMSYRLLLDEHMEHEVYHQLTDAGHNVEHVDCVPDLEKGSSDLALARYSVTNNRTIVTYDGFIEKVPPAEYRAVLFFEDDTLPPDVVAEIIREMAQMYPHEQVHGLVKTGRGCDELCRYLCSSHVLSGPEPFIPWWLAVVR